MATDNKRNNSNGPKISIRNLTVELGGRKILDSINLDIPAGDTLVIMGLSGMGKSTLIRSIIRLLEPDSGEIYIDGKEILKLGQEGLYRVRKKFGMLFQQSALFDSMT
ncbi:MAG: ATP-binding cassette domain-containing protein, partial [Vulcanimicrobiota bacterium]